MLLTITHFKLKDRFKIKGERIICHANTNQKEAGVAT